MNTTFSTYAKNSKIEPPPSFSFHTKNNRRNFNNRCRISKNCKLSDSPLPPYLHTY